MDKNSNKFVVGFTVVVCVVLAVMLAGAYNALRDSIAANEEFDKQRSILKAMGLWDPADEKTREELETMFESSVEAHVLEVKRGIVDQKVMRAGKEVTDRVEAVVDVIKTDYGCDEIPALLREESKKPSADRRELVPFYTRVGAGGVAEAFGFPISGYGLWSTLYGFLALDGAAKSVAGITFYKHGETPGLGGEIENPGWQKQWLGKQILNSADELVGVRVKKGGAAPDDIHAVDGLSGATITGDGVTRFVKRDLATYLPYLKKVR